MSSLWRISLRLPQDAEDAATELLTGILSQPAATYTKLASGKTNISVYLPRKAAWSPAARKEVAAGLRRLANAGLNLGRPRLRLERVQPEDWAESWKRHFQPLEVGSELLLKPSWSRCKPRKGQSVLVLDPGLSFGTGHHPTTGFCLRQLVAHRRAGRGMSFLDIGTGSGILALAAAKLGYSPVEAIDVDADSVRNAQANARRNRLTARVRIRQQDLARLPRRMRQGFAMVCANLTAPLLLAERPRIIANVQAGGALVLAGILAAEFDEVRRAFEAAGLKLRVKRKQREWCSARFEKPGNPVFPARP